MRPPRRPLLRTQPQRLAVDRHRNPLRPGAHGVSLALVDTGWFRSVEDVVLDALRRFLASHREELMEGLLREDVEWGLHGRD